MTRRSRPGAALLAALALLVLIAVVSLEVSVTAGARRRATIAAIEHTSAAAIADAGIETARAVLDERLRMVAGIGAGSSPSTLDPWSRLDAIAIDESLDGLRYSVSLRDAGTALNLVRATQDQLQRLFIALRMDAGAAERLAAAIADFRDADELRRPRGAETSDYLRSDRAVLPGDVSLRSVASLRHVLGVSDGVHALVAPYLTEAGSGRVNINSAPRPVLLTLPGMTDETAALILRQRGSRPIGDLSELVPQLSAGSRERLLDASAELARAVVFATQEVLVTSAARDEAGQERARIDALIVRDGGARLAWRRVAP